ncbi:MAG: rRNA maturation RNase YbeY [Lachnospiraceae bacterium]|nr:rRNA maturation RNase YbeY [Lachnospiraceae bacterium]
MIFCVENDTDFDPAAEAGIADVAAFSAMVGDEALALEGVVDPSGAEAALYLVGNDAIRELNLIHRNINEPTDVLSFPNIDYSDGHTVRERMEAPDPDCTDPETGRILLGDIVINTERVRSQAETYGHSVRREFAFLLAHSLFHLFGYDHLSEQEAAVMEQKQEQVLAGLKIMREKGADIG